uniref:Integrase core domain containing protein n=1 Tax=Solanum tuberosum TaxID=4113 RepID=M1DQ52_SOLTU
MSPTQADNVVTWDRVVMQVALLVGLEVDFTRIILVEIHEKAFRRNTTIPFPCLIFHLCRESTVPIWHCDRLVEVTKTVDVQLIHDDTNPAAPRRSTPVAVPPLGADLVREVELVAAAQDDDTSIPPTIVDAQAPPSTATSQVVTSRATPPTGTTLVPLARDHKLETQTTILLQHMRQWMQRSVEESEARMEMVIDAKIQAIHKRLDAVELRVLERHGPSVDITIFQTELARLRSNVDALLAPNETVPKTTPEVEKDEVVMTTFFGDIMPPPDPSRAAGKRHCSSDHTSDTEEVQRAKKRECQQLEAAQRRSIIDEELRQQRAQEIDVGPSGLRSTTNGVSTIDEGATDGVPIADPAGSGKLDPIAS